MLTARKCFEYFYQMINCEEIVSTILIEFRITNCKRTAINSTSKVKSSSDHCGKLPTNDLKSIANFSVAERIWFDEGTYQSYFHFYAASAFTRSFFQHFSVEMCSEPYISTSAYLRSEENTASLSGGHEL